MRLIGHWVRTPVYTNENVLQNVKTILTLIPRFHFISFFKGQACFNYLIWKTQFFCLEEPQVFYKMPSWQIVKGRI